VKVLLTLDFEGERDAFVEAMSAEVMKLLASGDASRGAVDVRVEGDELDVLQAVVTEHATRAVVSLSDARSPSVALGLALPARGHLVGGYVVDEVVQRDYERTWPAGAASPGVKLVCFVERRPDTSREAYRAHWRERHGPLALAHQPGFWRYVQNHIVERLTDTTPYVDGIGALHFRTAGEVFTGSFDSEEGMRLIMEDTERFMNHDASTTLPTNEYVIVAR